MIYLNFILFLTIIKLNKKSKNFIICGNRKKDLNCILLHCNIFISKRYKKMLLFNKIKKINKISKGKKFFIRRLYYK